MKHAQYILGLGCALILTGCVPEFDMHGQDPKEYYAEHPVENKVETRYHTQLLHLTPHHELEGKQKYDLKRSIDMISPLAVEDVEIHVHPSHVQDTAMHRTLAQTLSRMGIDRDMIEVVPMEEIGRHDASIQIAYSAVVSPRCPDWRVSSITTYTNMLFTPNIGCSSVTNLGLMVADPRDLVHGEGDSAPDTHNTTRAIQQYRTGESNDSDSEESSIPTTGQ
ncbi:MAG: CpaD family pilus assembly lipoprotein [Alphaproteobacteria bacterium]